MEIKDFIAMEVVEHRFNYALLLSKLIKRFDGKLPKNMPSIDVMEMELNKHSRRKADGYFHCEASS